MISTDLSQRSKEKNINWEETRKRNEASMARKRAAQKALNPAAAGAGGTDSPLSPSSTGAMDSLLEKLRAAAPQARDQRDRRRRARLKDRHQDRVASGQAMPEMDDLTPKPNDEGASDDGDKRMPEHSNGEKLNSISESEDVAERAANMLQGLRDKDDVNGRPGSRDGSLKIRRKRESVEEERRNRRRRRARESSSGTSVDEEGAGQRSGSRAGMNEEDTIMEDEEGEGDSTIVEDKREGEEGEGAKVVVSPPSPEPGAAKRRAREAAGEE